ncbi:MAG: hypothetical protein JWM87_1587 [Candidatus Eremiobacteraeota bacterium]|nr:hypothetical protein [Candidatus Eremiobacteraeota bacterium]
MPPLSKSEDACVTELASRTKATRDRAHFRPTAEQKELLVRAATLTGQTLSEFMRTAVEERAKRVIADHERIVLTDRSRDTFFAALADPPEPNDRLVALAHRYAREVKSRP